MTKAGNSYQALEREICEALGLDPGRVRKLTLRLQAAHMPLAEVEYFVDTPEGAVGRVLRRYRLEEVGGEAERDD